VGANLQISPVDTGTGIQVYDHARAQMIEERVLGDRLLRFAYLSPARPLCSLLLFRTALLSRFLGWYCDTARSRCKIVPTIRELGLDESEFRDPTSSFRTFNEFFTRHLRSGARPFDASPEILSSPADARLTVFPDLREGTCVPVKGAAFTVSELLRDASGDASQFVGGTLLVLRLCPADYHRFHYPASGRVLRRWEISGRLHSVNPLVLALGIPVFTQNRRIVTLLDLERFGVTAFVEVGAFGVAGIVQTHTGREFRKMDEKGLFRFGGSTVILVFRRGRVLMDPDLVERSRTGIETLVRVGEQLGRVGSI